MDVDEASSLQPIDRLLLAQAVWELGANSWPAVAKLLTKHPLLHHPKSFFTAQVSPLLFCTVVGLNISPLSVMPHHVRLSHERSRFRRVRF